MFWVILFIIILWFIFRNENNKENTSKAILAGIIKENIDVVEKGIKIYNDLITLIGKNQEFKKIVSSMYPHFIIRERNIMVAIPISSSRDTLHYFEEVYHKIQEKERDLYKYWIENISDCKELCSWLINDDSIQDYNSDYAIVCGIGRLRKNDDSSYFFDGETVVEEILNKSKKYS